MPLIDKDSVQEHVEQKKQCGAPANSGSRGRWLLKESICVRKDLRAFRREAKIAELIMSSTVYEDLLTKVNRGRQFYDKLESKVKHLLERTHRVCRAEQEERSRIRERLAPKGISKFYLFSLVIQWSR